MKSLVSFWRSVLGTTIVIFVIGMWRLNLVSRGSISLLHSNWTYVWAIPFGVVLFLFGISWTRPGVSWFSSFLTTTDRPVGFLSVLCGIAFVVSLPVLSVLVFYPNYASLIHHLRDPLAIALRNFSSAIQFISVRVLLFWGSVLFGMICSKIAWRKLSWFSALILSTLANAMVYCLVVDFSGVNNYPFSLGWSEISRYYGASLFFAKRIYGQQFPLPALHPTWHLLLTVPYIFGNLPIWVHRLWQACLQFALTLVTGIVFTRRLGIRRWFVFWGIALWAFLFLQQDLITFSLLPAAIIVLGWVESRRFWRTTLMVLLASVWAGLSRLNWFPVPGMLAGVLYLLEIPYRDSKSWAHYLWKPVTWLLGGTLLAFGVNSLYNVLSGNAIKGGQFASSLTSNLLWYRLLPNATYPIGILLAACLASAPLILIVFFTLCRYHQTFHPLRLAGIFTATGILLVGGLVVSIKIGGGSDLHNLDAYFVMLMLIGGYFYFRRWTPEIPINLPVSENFPVLALVIILPIWFILQTGGTLFTWNHVKANNTVEIVRARTQQIAQAGGEVLFISQRQLQALKEVDVPLIPAYEQDYLMEMVMSHNQAYLHQFQSDLRQHRFAMIVVGPQYDHLYKRDHGFSEENNLWVLDVSQPLLCYYQMANSPGMEPDVALYIPSSQPCK
ncbi:MAG: hypothetical protein ABSF99_13115 [Anaerolineales bacterium]|jgi:hypothetical protein